MFQREGDARTFPKHDDASARAAQMARIAHVVRANGLYGRDTEVGELLRTLDRVGKGRGELLLLSGPAGAGKTALAAALRRPARARNACFPLGQV